MLPIAVVGAKLRVVGTLTPVRCTGTICHCCMEEAGVIQSVVVAEGDCCCIELEAVPEDASTRPLDLFTMA